MPGDPVDAAIEVLNRIHRTDPSVLPALIAYRVPCNEALAGDPTVQVGTVDANLRYEVGFLGILNGLFGVDERGWGFIGAQFEHGVLVEFSRLGPRDS